MRIALDTLPLTSAHATRGTGVYTKNLIDALTALKTDHEFVFFNSQKGGAGGVDIVHYPYFQPFFLTLPLRKSARTVVTVHDLIPFVFPHLFPRGIKGTLKWQIQKRNLMRTDAVITDSLCSKGDIFKFANVPQSKIHVIPLAPSAEYTVPDMAVVESVKKRYHLPNKYILFVGDVSEYKNVSSLVKAFFHIAETASDTDLVLVGKAFGNHELPETKALLKLIENYNLHGRVHILSHVSFDTQDLVSIYSLATVYAQVTLYEGFGLPVLESMASGTPVVASRVASLPEVGGDAALYTDPYDTDDIAEKLMHVITMDAKSYEELKEKGFSWAKRFSWERVARETVAVYEAISV